MRELLEKKALESVCPCWYYELANDIDTMTDYDLKMIIDKPYICHIESAIQDSLSVSEMITELQECPEYSGICNQLNVVEFATERSL